VWLHYEVRYLRRFPESSKRRETPGLSAPFPIHFHGLHGIEQVLSIIGGTKIGRQNHSEQQCENGKGETGQKPSTTLPASGRGYNRAQQYQKAKLIQQTARFAYRRRKNYDGDNMAATISD